MRAYHGIIGFFLTSRFSLAYRMLLGISVIFDVDLSLESIKAGFLNIRTLCDKNRQRVGKYVPLAFAAFQIRQTLQYIFFRYDIRYFLNSLRSTL